MNDWLDVLCDIVMFRPYSKIKFLRLALILRLPLERQRYSLLCDGFDRKIRDIGMLLVPQAVAE